MNDQQIKGAIEAILYVSGSPLAVEDIASALEVSAERVCGALREMEDAYAFEQRGIRLQRFADKVQLCTRIEYAEVIERALAPRKKQSLSHAALETLAIIAYRQPVTRSEIEAIRGVKCDYSVQSLLAKNMIREVGRKDSVGHPILYGTTDDFLRYFGLSNLDDLPELIDRDEAAEDEQQSIFV